METSMEREFTEQDLQQFEASEQQLHAAKSTFDTWTIAGAEHNAVKLRELFEQNRNVPVSVGTIFKFIQDNSAQFRWLTEAQVNYFTVAKDNLAAASALEAQYPRHLVGKENP